ncbi:MAG: hypothetical protein ABIZ56_00910 [Chthoniobacteraceae bacterium]
MTSTPFREVLRTGNTGGEQTWVLLERGRIKAWLDPAAASLREVQVGNSEVLRGIYAAVRDRNWGTVEPCVRNLQVVEEADEIRVSFEVECRAGEIDFAWVGGIALHASGEIVFTFDGVARSSFWRNRIGFCVLHPPECAGRRCVMETCDGELIEGTFPRFIAPHQPFENMRAISYELPHGGRPEVRFAGEVFEMEDQRNWTDASFKTYCTPLARPFPVWVEAGTRIQQSITFRLLDAPAREVVATREPAPTLGLGASVPQPLPDLGLGCASHGQPLTARETALLSRLRLRHLRVDLHLSDDGWREALRVAAADATAIGTSLHVAVFVSAAAEVELATLARAAAALGVRVSLWLVFHEREKATADRWVQLARRILLPVDAGAQFAAGTNANFAELNRNRPPSESAALPCYSINPQAHAFDDRSLMENLGTQPATVESTWQFAPRPVVISPITLRPRFNPDATVPAEQEPGKLPPQVDPRQASLFGAAWTVGSLARLAALRGLHSLTYFETTGWRGVMETASGSACPELFRSLPGGVFPMYLVFAALADSSAILPTQSTDPLRFDGFCIIRPDGCARWMVANLTASPQRVRVLTAQPGAHVSILDETNIERVMREPETFAAGAAFQRSVSDAIELNLGAYAVAQLDLKV